MKMLYKYPQAEFPYTELAEENRKRDRTQSEFELSDTGIFKRDRYFDCFIEYAKAAQNELLLQVTVHNRGPEPAPIWVLPTIWFRNTWSWGYSDGPKGMTPEKPSLKLGAKDSCSYAEAQHPSLGDYFFSSDEKSEFIFTDNESNPERHPELPDSETKYCKDAFHRYLIEAEKEAVNPAHFGTKAASVRKATVAPGQPLVLRYRLSNSGPCTDFSDFDETLARRREECEQFYVSVRNPEMSKEEQQIQRQAFAGLLWSKQLYYYDIEQWCAGDPKGPKPPEERKRNHDWMHLTNFDLISMPDTWEFPWYAAWDLAFHCLPFSLVDADFAKRQLELMTREWYMHPKRTTARLRMGLL